jgi:putative membrane protein
MGFVVRVLINAAALWLASLLIPGIHLSDAATTLLAGLVLGIINAIVRPILIFLTLPITLVTLGLFIFVLNAFCLWLTSRIVPGFEVQGAWAALLGALVVSVVSWTLTAFLSDRGRVRRLEVRRLEGRRPE